MGRGYQPAGYPSRYMQSNAMGTGRGRRPGANYYNKGRKKGADKTSKSSGTHSHPPQPTGRGCTLETSKE